MTVLGPGRKNPARWSRRPRPARPPRRPPRPRVPEATAALSRYAIIGGSGVTIDSETTFSWPTPFGTVTNLAFLDGAKQRVLFVNRHFCTNIGPDGSAVYAPPHDIDFHALLWALKELHCKAVFALGSTGTLRPDTVPVGTIVMPDDFFCTLPVATTYWPHKVGLFEPDAAAGEVGRIHFAPAIPEDSSWVEFRGWCKEKLNAVANLNADCTAGSVTDAAGEAHVIAITNGQTAADWPALSPIPPPVPELVYVQAQGPRFEVSMRIAI